MAQHPTGGRHRPAAREGARVQPAVGADDEADPTLRSWVRETDTLREAHSVDRLAADLDLVNSLALRGFAGPEWDYVAVEIAKYGLAVLMSWMRRRVIFQRVKERGAGGLPEPPARAFDDEEVVLELASETVAKALFHFRRDVLMKGRWDPTRGAALRTYFIGQCLFRFANIYRQWWEKEARPEPPVDPHEALDLVDAPGESVERQAIGRVRIQRGLAAATGDDVRVALLLHAQDVPQREIAARLGTTTKAVERMIAYHRERMEKGIA